MSVNSRNEPNGLSLDWVKRQLRRLSMIEPPPGLKHRLLTGISRSSPSQTPMCPARRWSRGASWTGIAAAILVATAVMVWLGAPAGRSARPVADTNGGPGRVLAADYNGVRPPDINTSDSNGLY